MKKIFKSIGYGLSIPFVFLAAMVSLLFIKRKARKYKKDPNSIFLQDRLKAVYKVFNKFLYIKRVKVEAIDIESLPTKQMLYMTHTFYY